MPLYQYVFVIIDPCMAVFCMVAAIYAMLTRDKDRKSAKLMTCALLTGALYNIADTIGVCFDGYTTEPLNYLVRAATLISYISIFLLFAFEIGYLWRRTELRGGTQNKRIKMIGLVFCGIGMAAAVLACYSDSYYTFDSQNHFVAKNLYWVHLVLVVMATLPMLFQTIKNRNVFIRREFNAFLSLSLLPVFSVIIQQLIPWDVSLYIIGVSVSILIIFAVYRREASDLTMIRESMLLNQKSIDSVSADLDKFMTSLGMEKLNSRKVCLTIEDALSKMRDKFGEDEKFDVLALVSFGRPSIIVEKKGELFNPLGEVDDETAITVGKRLTSIGLNPVYSYEDKVNILRIPLPKRLMNPALKMLIALTIGIIAGCVGMICLSPADQQILCKDILRPVYEMMRNMLFCVSGPILLMMVMSAILDMSGVSEQGGNSIRIAWRYFVLSVLVGAVAILSELGILSGSAHIQMFKGSDLKTMFDGVLSVIPKDIFTPFVEANTPQLLLMAIILGLAISALGNKALGLSNGVRQLNMVGMKMADWTGRIIPFFAVAMAAILYMTGRINEIITLLPIISGSMGMTLICMAAVLAYVCLRWKVPASIIIRKCWPSFKIAFKEGSLDASYGQSEYCCVSGLGIDRHFTVSGINAGSVLYMPANIIGTLIFILYAAAFSDVTVSALWLVLAVVLAVMLFVATPPIPGANFLAYIAMMPILGVKTDFLMTALIFEIIYGIFASAANQFFVQMELVLQSAKLGLLNQDVLRSK